MGWHQPLAYPALRLNEDMPTTRATTDAKDHLGAAMAADLTLVHGPGDVVCLIDVENTLSRAALSGTGSKLMRQAYNRPDSRARRNLSLFLPEDKARQHTSERQ